MVSSIGFCCDSDASRHTLLSPPPQPSLYPNHRDSSNPQESWKSGREIQPAGRCPGGLVKGGTGPRGSGGSRQDPAWQVGAQGLAQMGGGSKDAVKGAPGPSGNCCLPDRPLPPPPGPHSHPQASPTGADTPSSQTKLPAPTSSSNRLPFCPEDKSQEILLCPLPGGLSPQKPLQRSPLFVPVSPLLQTPPGCLN